MIDRFFSDMVWKFDSYLFENAQHSLKSLLLYRPYIFYLTFHQYLVLFFLSYELFLDLLIDIRPNAINWENIYLNFYITDYCKNFGRLSNFFKSYASLRFFFQNPRCWVLFLPKLELFCVWKPRKAFLVVANILPLSLTGSSLANDLVISKKNLVCLID